MKKVLFIPADTAKPLRVVELPADEGENGDQQSDAMRKLVGGWLEVIPCPTDEAVIWCNEEGRMMRLPANSRARTLWSQIWGEQTDTILGDVFVSGKTDHEGCLTSISQSVVDALEKATK